jgi:hypothetical protein
MESIRACAQPRLARRRACCVLGGMLFTWSAQEVDARPAAFVPADRGTVIGASLVHALQRASAIRDGYRGDLAFAFFDALCPACASLYLRTRAAIARGALRIRWIPVSLLGEESLAAGARLLTLARSGRAPAAARSLAGAWPSRDAGSPDWARHAVRANTQVLRLASRGSPVTPSLVVRASGGPWTMISGLPAQ